MELGSLGGLKWKLRKPVCIREHRGSLSSPLTIRQLKAIQLSVSLLRSLTEAAVYRYGVASRLPSVQPSPLTASSPVVLLPSGQPNAGCVEFGDSPYRLGDAKSPVIQE